MNDFDTWFCTVHITVAIVIVLVCARFNWAQERGTHVVIAIFWPLWGTIALIFAPFLAAHAVGRHYRKAHRRRQTTQPRKEQS